MAKALELMGIRDWDAWKKKTEPPIPPLALDILQKQGVNPRLIKQAVDMAQRADPRLAEQQGPDVQQVDQAMGVNGNGAQPEEAPA